ncbi:hypothetical protein CAUPRSCDRAFT_12460 [Caulochytrium protostelioides]|nr:hypothetical protein CAUPRSCDRAFT_12460 [Caulochytrium protostelioides]
MPKNPSDTVFARWEVKAPQAQEPTELDYLNMNRQTAARGLKNVRNINAFQKQNKLWIHNEETYKWPNVERAGRGRGAGSMRHRGGPLPSDGNLSFTYGRLVRPSTPVSQLMALSSFEAPKPATLPPAISPVQRNMIISPPPPRKAKEMPRHMRPVEELFHMTKFVKHAHARVQSYRPSDDAAMHRIVSRIQPAKQYSVLKTASA